MVKMKEKSTIRKQKTVIKLKGMLKKYSFSDEEINKAKKSLFKIGG